MVFDNFPSGTLTFLFSDIQGSTPLWEKDPAGMSEALALHNDALHAAIQAHGGRVFKIIGDEFQAVFLEPREAIEAAVAGQRALNGTSWNHIGPLRVRMGIHSGPAEWEGLDYAVSHTFNRTARIMSTGHGGQILISVEAVQALGDGLPAGVTLEDTGRHRLKGLTQREHLFQVNTPGLPQKFPPLKTVIGTSPKIQHNLPQPSTPFIGRQKELVELGRLFSQPDTRLVTITGAGGMGKTRLALEYAWRRRGQYTSGVHFISLAPLTAPEQILPTTAHVIGLQFKGDREPQDQLLRYLQDHQALLIFDNFEHLREGAELVQAILEAAPQVDVLTTSRERLDLAAEALYEMAGMALPLRGENTETLFDTDAVRMFIACARRMRPEYQLNSTDETSVASLCRLVEGMPLAIELASSWIRVLSPAEIIDELQDDLRILERESPDVPPRQRSMEASFDYSWRLLSEKERSVLMKLSVFRGGCSRRSAKEVAGANIHTLSGLIDKSMLSRDPETGRFQMHELLRQLSEERLVASGLYEGTIHDHADNFMDLVMKAQEQAIDEAGLANYDQMLEQELDNCRAAMQRSLVSGNVARALRLATKLADSTRLMWREQAKWLDDALTADQNSVPTLLRAEAQLELAKFMLQGDVLTHGRVYWSTIVADALAVFEEYRDDLGIAKALHMLGFANYGHNFDMAVACYSQAIAVYDRLGQHPVTSLYHLAASNTLEGNLAKAKLLYARISHIAQITGDELLEIEVQAAMAQIAYYEGDLALAKAQSETVLYFRSSKGRQVDSFTRFIAHGTLLDVALDEQDLEQSRQLIHKRLLHIKQEDAYSIAMFLLHQIAFWQYYLGNDNQVPFWIGNCQSTRDEWQQPLEKVERPRIHRLKEDVRALLGDERYLVAYKEGYATRVEDAVGLALGLVEGASKVK